MVTLPIETRTYKPVAHQYIIDLTKESLKNKGLEIDRLDTYYTKDGQIMTAKVTIANLSESDLKFMISFQNSYNKKLAIKYCLGSEVKICRNGLMIFDAFSLFNRRHRGTIVEDLPMLIDNACSDGTRVFESIIDFKEKSKLITVSKDDAIYLVSKLFFKEKIINVTQLSVIKNQFKKPMYDYGAPGSLWELYNHITFALKSSHPIDAINNHLNLHEYIKKEYAIV